MIYLALFAIVSVLGMVLAALVFAFKDILHSAVALSGVFFVNSLLFLALGQPLLAVIQLFIMIGGITTFIFVGVASATYPEFRLTKLIQLCILSAVLFLIMIAPLSLMHFNQTESNVFTGDAVTVGLSSSASIFYLILLTLFGVSLGAILLLKKVGAKK
ncbi:MAG: NADH-quinone oxidoreductase subunit J [Candidatus Micrarchaeales archaeon]